MVQSQNTIQYV